MTERFLITTADERTWPIDNPAVFLGKWCCLYNRREFWKNFDSVVVPYHWDDREKLNKDYKYLKLLHEELLFELSSMLNQIHSVEHSTRYWQILIGPWLGFFTQMLFDRWSMIERVSMDYKISGVYILDTPMDIIVPNDMEHFQRLYLEDLWNEAIYGQLICNFTKINVDRNFTKQNNQKEFLSRDSENIICDPLSRKIKNGFRGLAIKAFQCFVRNNENFLISTYMPFLQDFLLQLAMGQYPKFWTPVPTPKAKLNLSKRSWKLDTLNKQGFDYIIRIMIPWHLPLLYLEGYDNLQNLIDALPWPKNPKMIFTSNSFNSDDVFKAWTATKVEKRIPYVIGQHGGNYGNSRWNFSEDHEIASADSFVSWGWNDASNKKILPFGNLKLMNKRLNGDPKGNALLVETNFPRYSYQMYSVPIASQWYDYFEEQCLFVAKLPKVLQKQLLVRLYLHDYGWRQYQRWKDIFPEIQLDDSSTSMVSLIKQSRLYISTYNATTFLESLSLNVPSIIFWNPKHWELRDDAIPYFNRLKEVGIFYETPESAAAKVVEIWDEIPDWWNHKDIQAAREYFCDRFSRTVKNPTIKLKDILLSVKA